MFGFVKSFGFGLWELIIILGFSLNLWVSAFGFQYWALRPAQRAHGLLTGGPRSPGAVRLDLNMSLWIALLHQDMYSYLNFCFGVDIRFI